MKSFNNRECSAQYVLKIKKLYKQQLNNPNIIQQYNAILNDTNIAIENLNECINSSVMLNNMFNSIKQEDISFMKELLGVIPRIFSTKWQKYLGVKSVKSL